MKMQYFSDTDTLLIDVDKAGTVCSITIEHATGGSGMPTVASTQAL